MHLAGSFSHHLKQGCCSWHRKPEVKPKTPRTGSSAALPGLWPSSCDPVVHFQSQTAALGCQEEVVWAGFPLLCCTAAAGSVWAQIQLSSSLDSQISAEIRALWLCWMKAPAVQKPDFKNPAVKYTQRLPEHITAFEPELLPGLPNPFGDRRDPIPVVKYGQRPSGKWESKNCDLKMCF